MSYVVSYLLGAVFAVGLGIAGMTRPTVVRAFLDPWGAWDPRLAVVMAVAIATNVVVVALAGRRAKPLFGERFALPRRRDVDVSLVAGATLFGIGWGLSGYCPGPALVGAAALRGDAILVALGTVLGMLVHFTLPFTAGTRAARSGGPASADG